MVCASSRELEMSNLTALSPLDGRFWRKFKELASSMSEFRLIYFRALGEIKWLPKLSNTLSKSLKFQALAKKLRFTCKAMEKIEKVTNHDVKAVDYFLDQKCESHQDIAKV
ncbi:hypothetical protein ARALYDRAFT_320487 [Arabidopsis lyrata subsp. lyrata]|uniref:Uncharacterized protein n=1 Tax=Arabidopsis lyrata subsp. lyrata TaxID=81972 RepID=D7LFH5_ARALL|nr:hypothetical protein ARALYDRAFT_320487 [Arabidopsis lyrata subsp. lyrata]